MSVIGGILLFVAGITVGGSAVAYNHYSVQRVTTSLRKENEHLKESSWRDKMDFETSKAYGKGYRDGRRNPLTDVERFADTLEEGGFDFKMTRRAKRGKEDPA